MPLPQPQPCQIHAASVTYTAGYGNATACHSPPQALPVCCCLIPGNWLLCPRQKICQLEPEGRVKVDVVLRAAEALLARCHEDQKPQILARLRDVKAQWEETVTYMTHCHR